MTQVAHALHEIKQRLAPVSDTPGLDAQVLLAHLLGVSRAWILAHPEAALAPDQVHNLQADLARLEAGLPLPYVLGRWEFYGRDFLLSPAVLIPRPETELLVERAIGWLEKHPERRLAVDVGTGSGCIAVSLAAHFPDLKILAVELSMPAARVAQANARRYQLQEQMMFLQSDLLTAISQPLDLICANLPYIQTSTLRRLKVHAHEPELALNGGDDGLCLIKRLMDAAPQHLTPGGAIMLEIEANQGQAVLDMARQAFAEANIRLHTDLSGRDRLVEILLPH